MGGSELAPIDEQKVRQVGAGEDGFFYGLYLVPPDARLDYLLTVDGKEATDPRNSHVTPSGFGPHSEIAMPKFKPTAVLKANQVLRDELQRRGINPRYQVYNDGHQWANWRERTDVILCYFFPPGND